MSTNSRIAILFLLETKTNAFAQEMTLEQAAMKSNKGDNKGDAFIYK
jgi:hypothetical protein